MVDYRFQEPTPDQQAQRYLRNAPNATAQTREAFAKWLRRSPEHVAAVLRHQMLNAELKGLDPARQIDVGKYISQAKASSTLVPWPGPVATGPPVDTRTSPPKILRNSIAAGIGALALTGAALWVTLGFHTTPVTYSTGIGQHEQFRLPDGSTVELNTQSTMQVRFSQTHRDVYLLGGEALFEVRHNSAVPFRVHAGSTVIEDVGTQFNVRRAAGLTTVSVLEGSVEISADRSATSIPEAGSTPPAPTVVVASQDYHRSAPKTHIGAGEEIRIVADGTLMQRQSLDPSQATAWRQGRLVFSDASLEEVVSEFNRYNARQIILVGEAHRMRHYSGIFDATDPQSFLEYLRKDDAGLAIENDAGKLIIRGP